MTQQNATSGMDLITDSDFTKYCMIVWLRRRLCCYTEHVILWTESPSQVNTECWISLTAYITVADGDEHFTENRTSLLTTVHVTVHSTPFYSVVSTSVQNNSTSTWLDITTFYIDFTGRINQTLFTSLAYFLNLLKIHLHQVGLSLHSVHSQKCN